MTPAGAARHLVPMNSFVRAAPQKTARAIAIHRKEYVATARAKRRSNRLGLVLHRGAREFRKPEFPGRAIVGRGGNLEGRPLRKISSAAEEPDFFSILPQQ